jgi:hypothetical protein
VEIGVGGQVWVGLGRMAIMSHFRLAWGGLMEIYLCGMAEFHEVL